MTPEQKLEAIRKAVDYSLSYKGEHITGSAISAAWLKNLLDLPPSSFTGKDDPDMERVIKTDMQLHEASCATNKTYITPERRGCTCWLADPPKPVYTRFQIVPKSQYTKITSDAEDFETREQALDWFRNNTLFSTDPDSNIYWGKFYDIKAKETTTV